MYNHFRCCIHGNIEVNRAEFQIINHPFFQRLRYINQLGFASLVFPCATHTRFAHSLGTMHLAGQFFDTLLKNSPILRDILSKKERDYFKKITRLAGLLHDIGHAPYSHVTENLLPQLNKFKEYQFINKNKDEKASHEDISVFIILAISPDFPDILDQQSIIDISSLILGKNLPDSSFYQKNYNIFHLLKHIISGEIDVDRMDYLLRDAFFTGVSYGQFDKEHLLFSLACDIKDEHFFLYLSKNAVTAYENFLLARYHMFIQIYFHKSLPSYRYYLKKAIEENEIQINIHDGDLDQYLKLNDYTVFSQILITDQQWSEKIKKRETMKVLDLHIQPSKNVYEQLEEELQLLQKQGIDVELFQNRNAYSSQSNTNLDRLNTLYVRASLTLDKIFLPVMQVSQLLKNLPDSIEVIQLAVDHKQYEASLSLLKKIRNSS